MSFAWRFARRIGRLGVLALGRPRWPAASHENLQTHDRPVPEPQVPGSQVRQQVKGRRTPEPAGLAKLGQVLDRRPVLVALVGANGAGKTTFFHSHLKPAGLRFLNADEMARELEIDAYGAVKLISNCGRNWLGNGRALSLSQFSPIPLATNCDF